MQTSQWCLVTGPSSQLPAAVPTVSSSHDRFHKNVLLHTGWLGGSPFCSAQWWHRDKGYWADPLQDFQLLLRCMVSTNKQKSVLLSHVPLSRPVWLCLEWDTSVLVHLLPLSLSLQHAEEKAREQEKGSRGTSSSPLKAHKSKAEKKRASLKQDDDFKPTAGCL